ncbi:WD repeat domain 82-like protein [Umbelopsis sp. PMI_123]|nr:WD repeat domain 82-like protein [Umbelopsis sp. PMI_123]
MQTQLDDAAQQPLALSLSLISTFKAAKVFNDNTSPISSLSFDDTGELCVTSSSDESIHIYNCREGTLQGTLFSKKYGVHLARFTHRSSNVIYASTKDDDSLRYLSLHDNKYIRYFRGHKKKVISVEMSPLDDVFLSASLDETVRLWDLRSSSCQGLLNVSGRPTIAFDPSGLTFAVGLNSNTIKIYDVKTFDKGPFATWTLSDHQSPQGFPTWTSLKFTNDGKNILITTVGNTHYLVDAFEGHLKQRFEGHIGLQSPDNGGCDAGLSPDGRFVFAGSQDGSLCVWDIENPSMDNKPIKILKTEEAPLSCFGFNPKYTMMVTGHEQLALWQPSLTIST